jgi:hypothetical protein
VGSDETIITLSLPARQSLLILGRRGRVRGTIRLRRVVRPNTVDSQIKVLHFKWSGCWILKTSRRGAISLSRFAALRSSLPPNPAGRRTHRSRCAPSVSLGWFGAGSDSSAREANNFASPAIFRDRPTCLLSYKGIDALGVAITDPIRATTPLFSAAMDDPIPGRGNHLADHRRHYFIILARRLDGPVPRSFSDIRSPRPRWPAPPKSCASSVWLLCRIRFSAPP